MKVGGRAQYVDYYEKVHSYASAISSPAKVLDPEATPLTRRVCESEDEDSPFAYMDTASARAEINMVTRKLAADRIAIVGLGGTGSYVLDLLSKCPIKEIHIFDGDTFSSHNAFRAPGAIAKEDLGKQPLKADYFHGVYSRLHLKIIAHPEYIDAGNLSCCAT
ncbi:MAG: ThiF family adenylyltransferase [Betaproteobacteria bacterium]|nr:ThiF family adenylyltransferase [Betaproteobacteria bacterium]